MARLKRMPERVSTSWMTARPMPLPSGLVEKNGVKRLRAASSGMGRPLSDMQVGFAVGYGLYGFCSA